MSEVSLFLRGDVVLAPIPLVNQSAQAKMRPAVVIQNDAGNRFSPHLIVAAISSQVPRRRYPTNFIVRADSPAAEGAGLDRESVVHAELLFTIPRASVVRRLGRFNDTAMQAIDQCIRVSLALTS